jgi:hypothetical protein
MLSKGQRYVLDCALVTIVIAIVVLCFLALIWFSQPQLIG